VGKLARAILSGLVRWPWLVPAVAIVAIAVLGQYGPAWLLTDGAIWLAVVALVGGVVLAAGYTPRRTPAGTAAQATLGRSAAEKTEDGNEVAEGSASANRRTDLRCAILTNARLAGADLREADLRGADLRGADLRGADLSGANLEGALLGPPADEE
jgi:hypothetical protein